MTSGERFFVPIVLVGPVVLEQKEIDQLSRLLNQLSAGRGDFLYNGNVAKIIEQDNFRLVVVKHPDLEEIIAMASLHYCKTLRHCDRGVGIIDDVAVDERFRGLGLGDLMLGHIKELAGILGLERLELTSNPSREAANRLYLKHGFKKRDTSCYRLDI